MKKATAPTVAQKIKSTTQLSPPNWVDDLDRLQKTGLFGLIALWGQQISPY